LIFWHVSGKWYQLHGFRDLQKSFLDSWQETRNTKFRKQIICTISSLLVNVSISRKAFCRAHFKYLSSYMYRSPETVKRNPQKQYLYSNLSKHFLDLSTQWVVCLATFLLSYFNFLILHFSSISLRRLLRLREIDAGTLKHSFIWKYTEIKKKFEIKKLLNIPLNWLSVNMKMREKMLRSCLFYICASPSSFMIRIWLRNMIVE
jgi:hypothetical protein